MRKPLRIGVATAFWVAVAWLPASAIGASPTPLAAIGVSLDQCQNRPSGLGDCTGSAWATGNINPQNSLYKEGDFVPFRATVTGLQSGATYTLRIAYDAVESGLHAYDYVGSYNGSEGAGTQKIVPCENIAGASGPHACGNAPSNFAVPPDTKTVIPSGTQTAGFFSTWGGSLTGAAYVQPAQITVGTTGTVERQIDVTFAADGDTVVVSWGGHIASSLDWGQGKTFVGSSSGASFHMRVLQIQKAGQPPTITGNRDLSLHGTAIAPVPSPFSTQVSPQTIPIGSPVVDTANLGGGAGAGPTGVVHFFVCFAASVAPSCSSGGLDAGVATVVAVSAIANAGTASTEFVPEQTGRYCFRAEYEPDPAAPYSPGSHTDTSTECFQATLPPPSLTVTKLCPRENDPGSFNLLVDSVARLLNGACGSSTGPVTVAPGGHTVSETAGTNTSLADYDSLVGGNCAPNGTVTLALGQSATCTITNVLRDTSLPPLELASLTVNKICDQSGDSGLFNLYIDDLRFADVPCGGTTGAVTVTAGAHAVREDPGSGTSFDDYSARVIGGDCASGGSITLASGAAATCTITNTLKPKPKTTLRIDKLCPPGDEGRFNLTIDGETAGTGDNVPCGGTTGAVDIASGFHLIGETGAGSTDLSDYQVEIGGDCLADGSITLETGDQAECTITNIHNDVTPQPALITVNKICVPSDDGGSFTLHIDAVSAANEPCGGRLGPIAVSPGSHQVSETAGTGTRLSDYTATFGGDCAADGSITLKAGESANCTITNTRPSEPTSTVDVKEVCIPSSANADFQFQLDGQEFPNMSCGESSGPIETDTGRHLVEQPAEVETGAPPGAPVAAPTPPPAPFTPPEGAPTQPVVKTTIRGDCDKHGVVRLRRGQHAVCLVVHRIRRVHRGPKPAPACYRLVVTHRALVVGVPVTLVGRILLHSRPVQGAHIHLQGLGASLTLTTARNGEARFVLRFRRAGVVRLTTRRQFGCRKPPTKNAGVVAGETATPVTG